MDEWVNIISFIIAVLSFVLAVIGVWDKISAIYYNWALKANEKKIIIKEKRLAEVKKLNEQPNYFLASVFQKLFIMVTVFFLAYIFGLSIPHVSDVKFYNVILGGIASFIIGNIAGNSYRVCRSVTHYEQVVSKLEQQIVTLKVKP
jgi:hypothetical protein